MLTDGERRRGAQLLFDAERQRKAIPQLSETFPGIETLDVFHRHKVHRPGLHRGPRRP